jgi:hypothetical protein
MDLDRIRPGWYWWEGRGNQYDIEGRRVIYTSKQCVYVWIAEVKSEMIAMADSACWKKPLRVDEMGGEWLGPVPQPIVKS